MVKGVYFLRVKKSEANLWIFNCLLPNSLLFATKKLHTGVEQ
jgi:hypothetical protein